MRRAEVKTLAADAGYDGENNFAMLREMGLRAVIPPKLGPLGMEPKTPLRAQMWHEFRGLLTRY